MNCVNTNKFDQTRLRIVFVGDLNTHARSYQRYRAMHDLGHKVFGVTTVPIPTLSGLETKRNPYSKLRRKLGYPLDSTRANQQIVQMIAEIKPNILWIEKGLEIRSTSLSGAKDRCPDTILTFFSEDDMYARHNQSTYFRRSLQYYDLVITTKSYNVKELPEIGAKRVIFIDQSYDRLAHRPISVLDRDKNRLGADVIFIGNFENHRFEQMLYLAQHGIRIRIWGNGWLHVQDHHPNLMVEGKPLYGEEYTRAICASKIGLCFLRKINRDLQTSRTFEIPACGVFMLAERTSEHLRLFKEGREAEYFGTKDELLAKVRFFLKNEDARNKIAAAGRRRCIQDRYSHHDRLGLIFMRMNRILSDSSSQMLGNNRGKILRV